MKILCTFPGRYGDILWSLPTVRAISEYFGDPVHFLIAGEFAALLPVLQNQPYIRLASADTRWTLTPPNEWQPPYEHTGFDRVFHLGYRRWPQQPLPLEMWTLANHGNIDLAPLDLTRPWIDNPSSATAWDVAVGFSEAHFELKAGLLSLLEARPGPSLRAVMPAGRWTTETHCAPCSWSDALAVIQRSEIVLGCCSALHVLARAMGKPVVLMEPMEARWNPIFYPYGKTGQGVELVTGHDGLPTFDARHVRETLDRVLQETMMKGGVR
jgi:hypothetical protein